MMHPELLLELARIREQEMVRAAALSRAARDLRSLRPRRGPRQWLARRFQWWLAPGGVCPEPGSALPPILQPSIRRESR
ncbi:MAG: hypothetical protein ABSE52_12275 [Candidatus Dormibacteria bacterium]|jgi:hypothetical protein